MADDVGPPPGCYPMMMTQEQMEKRDLKTGTDVEDVVEYKLFNKEAVIKETFDIGFYSPFHDFRDKIGTYPEEEILIVADPHEKYGQNWFIALTPEAKAQQLEVFEARKREEQARLQAIEDKKRQEREEEERLANMVYEDKPVVARPYESEEAENTIDEVDQLTPHSTRPLLRVRLSRPLRDFGQPVALADRDADASSHADSRSHKDPAFGELSRRTMSMGLQATPGLTYMRADCSTQTRWQRRVNAATQYAARELTAEDAAAAMGSDAVAKFLAAVRPATEEALQQNEMLDVFRDEVGGLGGDDVALGDDAESRMRELRSFTDLRFSKGKRISCLDWHPTTRGLVAVACGDNSSYDDRVETMGRATTSHLLVWTFGDLIHPQLVLESPDEVTCFRYNPDNPNIIAAGTMGGQVLYWDLAAAYRRLQAKNTRASGRAEPGPAAGAADDGPSVPHIAPTVISAIELCHKRPVAALQWMPDRQEVGARGAVTAAEDRATHQFATVASDGQVLVWDLRYKSQVKRRHVPGQQKKKEEDVPWGPLFKLPLFKPGSMSALNLCTLVVGGMDRMGRLFCGTEEGELAAVEWPAEKGIERDSSGFGGLGGGDDDSGGPDFVRWLERDHYRPSVSLRRSPFFPGVLLSVGDWNFNLWRESMQQPVFTSAAADTYLTCGRWSPTRPAVLFLGRVDGRVDVWDLADQTHKPVLSEVVASGCRVTTMEFYSAKTGSGQAQQLLAAGDDQGNLHVIDLPRALCKPMANEEQYMQQYMTREAQRVDYVAERDAVRQKEREAKEAAEVAGDQDDDLANAMAPAVAAEDADLEQEMAGAAAASGGVPSASSPGRGRGRASGASLPSGAGVVEDEEAVRRREEAERARREEEEQLEAEYRELEEKFRKELGVQDGGEVGAGDISMDVA